MENHTLSYKLFEATGIKMNVYPMLDKHTYNASRQPQELKLESKVYILATGEGFDFEFSAKTPKKEISLTWIIKAIASEYKKFEKRVAKTGMVEVQPFEKVIKFKLSYHWFYVTEYGIGLERLFLGIEKEKVLSSMLDKFLEAKNVDYSNEYSEAFWVLRFKISNDYNFHNELLNEFSQTF